MLHLLSDENVDGDCITGLRRRRPELDLVRAQDVGLYAALDPPILEWAAGASRIVITQDINTMIGYAYARVEQGLVMPGVFVLRDGFTIGEWIDAILLVDFCSEQDEWRDQVVYLPM